MRNDRICVILTGGKSRRMGADKALLPLEGEALSLRLAGRMEAFGPVYFAVDRAGRFPVGRFGELVDRYPGCGPLNGLVSAFCQTDAAYALLVATDMPAAEPDAAQRLAENIGRHDACIYGDEPLFALYGRTCLAAAESCLCEGKYAMRAMLDRVDVLRLAPADEMLFSNVNTPAQWEQYIRASGGKVPF